jgi:ribosomal protein S27AE
MAWRKLIAALPVCPRCGAQSLHADARFCGHCGASLTEAGTDLPRVRGIR